MAAPRRPASGHFIVTTPRFCDTRSEWSLPGTPFAPLNPGRAFLPDRADGVLLAGKQAWEDSVDHAVAGPGLPR